MLPFLYYVFKQNKNVGPLESVVNGLKRWLGGQVHLLLLQRTKAWFKNPHLVALNHL